MNGALLHQAPHLFSKRGEAVGVFVGSQEGDGGALGARRRLRTSVGPPLHRLLILRHWLAPKGDREVSTCEDLAGKAVQRLVGGLQVHDIVPMDTRPLHPNLWCKLT